MQLIYSKKLTTGTFQVWNDRPDFSFLEIKQVHSTEVVDPSQIPCEADGLIIQNQIDSKPIAIKTADCLPILIEGQNGISFLHAGWRGLAEGIIKNPKLKEIKPFAAFIGPCIQSCCFEVTEEFKNYSLTPKYFFYKEKKLYFDLVREATFQLQEHLHIDHIEDSKKCTCCLTEFNSYRRNKTPRRNFNTFIKDTPNG